MSTLINAEIISVILVKDFPQGIMSRVRIKLFFFKEEKQVCTLASKFACVIALNVET